MSILEKLDISVMTKPQWHPGYSVCWLAVTYPVECVGAVWSMVVFRWSFIWIKQNQYAGRPRWAKVVGAKLGAHRTYDVWHSNWKWKWPLFICNYQQIFAHTMTVHSYEKKNCSDCFIEIWRIANWCFNQICDKSSLKYAPAVWMPEQTVQQFVWPSWLRCVGEH